METVDVTRMERLWETRVGWVLPFGAPWKIGRRHGANPPAGSKVGVFLVWDVWSVRAYERGRHKTISEAEHV